MTEVRIILPPGFFGASSSDDFIDTAMRVIGVGFGDEDEWASKYGTNYENDVFMMQRFCWCEREGECPWCTGCGAYEETCAACTIPHAIECLQSKIDAHMKRSKYERYDMKWFDERRETARKLAEQAGHKIEGGVEWLCDCGTDERRKAARDTDGCDYHKGTGIFSRWSPHIHDDKRRYYDPPNFWFKPSDFRLIWYKYIGRDMAANKDELPGDFIHQVFATHPKGMTAEQAFEKFAQEQDEHDKAFEAMLADLNSRQTEST